MKPALRVAMVKDIDTLVRFMKEYYSFDSHPFHEAKARKAMEGLLQDGCIGIVWLIFSKEPPAAPAREENKPVGYIVLTLGYSLEFHGRDAFIDEFYIEQRYRGKGMGRQALQMAESYARKIGVKAIHLEATVNNENALKLYKRAGFKDHKRHLLTKRIAP